MQIFTHRLTHITPKQNEILTQQQQQGQFLLLDYDTRQRSRFRAVCENGEAVGVDLPRTGTLKNGDVVMSDTGELLQIISAKQLLTQVTAESEFALMKASYHLGNRHVPLMIVQENMGQENGNSVLYFEPDYVLAQMLVDMGLMVSETQASFEPETGAYHSHNHDTPLAPLSPELSPNIQKADLKNMQFS